MWHPGKQKIKLKWNTFLSIWNITRPLPHLLPGSLLCCFKAILWCGAPSSCFNPFSQKSCQEIWEQMVPYCLRKWYFCWVFDHTLLLGTGLSATCAIRIRYMPRKMKMAYLLSLSEDILTIASKPESMASIVKTYERSTFILSSKSRFEGCVCTIIWRQAIYTDSNPNFWKHLPNIGKIKIASFSQ